MDEVDPVSGRAIRDRPHNPKSGNQSAKNAKKKKEIFAPIRSPPR